MSTAERAHVFACGPDQLVGILHSPQRRVSNLGILIVVGGPQYRVGSHRQFVLTARALARAGFAVMRFDVRGMGDSAGTFPGFESLEADIRAAIDAFQRLQPDLSGIVLWGLCDGASAASLYCNGDGRVRGLVLANPWVRSIAGEARAFLRYYYLQRVLQGSFWRKIVSREFSILRSIRSMLIFARDSRQPVDVAGKASDRAPVGGSAYIERMRRSLGEFTSPILILLSERDLTAKEFQDLTSRDPKWRKTVSRRNVKTETLPEADHTFSSPGSLERAVTVTGNWLRQLDVT